MLDAAVVEDGVGRFERRLGDDADQVVDAQVAVDRLVEPPHAFGRDLLAAGMRIDDERVAAGDHADGVAGDRRQRVRDRRDRADDAERGVLDDGQAVVAAEDFAPHELDAGRPLAERLELFDLVLQPADLRLFHLHRAQLDALVDRDAADVVDDPLAVFDRPLAEAARTPRVAAATASSTQVKTPYRPANDLPATGAARAVPTSASTWATTLRISSSVTCMVGSSSVSGIAVGCR